MSTENTKSGVTLSASCELNFTGDINTSWQLDDHQVAPGTRLCINVYTECRRYMTVSIADTCVRLLPHIRGTITVTPEGCEGQVVEVDTQVYNEKTNLVDVANGLVPVKVELNLQIHLVREEVVDEPESGPEPKPSRWKRFWSWICW